MQGLIKLSHHASRDRVERLSRIVMEVGLGKSLLEFKSEGRPCTITSTGVLMIWETEGTERVLLTAYLLSVNKAMAIYKKNRQRDIPRGLYNTILRNLRVHEEIYHIYERD